MVCLFSNNKQMFLHLFSQFICNQLADIPICVVYYRILPYLSKEDILFSIHSCNLLGNKFCNTDIQVKCLEYASSYDDLIDEYVLNQLTTIYKIKWKYKCGKVIENLARLNRFDIIDTILRYNMISKYFIFQDILRGVQSVEKFNYYLKFGYNVSTCRTFKHNMIFEKVKQVCKENNELLYCLIMDLYYKQLTRPEKLIIHDMISRNGSMCMINKLISINN